VPHRAARHLAGRGGRRSAGVQRGGA
jgi:hypothetical protein